MTQQPDQYTSAAIETEQRLLQEASIRAQSEYLLNRVITLSAENNRLQAELDAITAPAPLFGTDD